MTSKFKYPILISSLLTISVPSHVQAYCSICTGIECCAGIESGSSSGSSGDSRHSNSGSNDGAAAAQAIMGLTEILTDLSERNHQERLRYEQIEKQLEKQRWAEEQRLNKIREEQEKRDKANALAIAENDPLTNPFNDDDGAGSKKQEKPKEADTTEGCPFLEYTNYGLTHIPGKKYCFNQENLICDIAEKVSDDKWKYAWRKVDTLNQKGCLTDFVSPHIDESNSKSLIDTNNNFFDKK